MQQKAILAGVCLDGDARFEQSMKELESLAEACGLSVVGVLSQNLDKVNGACYIGMGKVAELALYVRNLAADAVVFNDELSPSQIRNLDETLGCVIKDRTMLILDIFAQRARTAEAKLQVEVARLQYMLPRLVGSRTQLEQQTGGVGTTNRGAGEKKLELSRRQIQLRISRLEKELEALAAKRTTQRRRRQKSELPLVSLVGYTNTGKSTLLNALLARSGEPEAKRVLEKDQLFATLETSVRKITLPDRRAFLLADTVGFVDRLPHHLVRAFHSTLEEALESDLLLHVIDCSNPGYAEQEAVTDRTLAQLGADGIPLLRVYNKADLADIRPAGAARDAVFLSAKTGVGLPELLERIAAKIFEDYVRCRMLVPYAHGDAVRYLNEHANIFSSEYRPEGTLLSLECRRSDCERLRAYLLDAAH